MPMYNFFEYSDNYSTTSGNLSSYHRDEINDDENDNDDIDNRTNKNKTIKRKPFNYKPKIIGSTADNGS